MVPGGARLCLLSMLLGEERSRDDVGNCRLQLVVPATDDVSFAIHHRVETDLRDSGWVILLASTNFGMMDGECVPLASRHRPRMSLFIAPSGFDKASG
jgi:hypothetical protein